MREKKCSKYEALLYEFLYGIHDLKNNPLSYHLKVCISQDDFYNNISLLDFVARAQHVTRGELFGNPKIFKNLIEFWLYYGAA